MFPHRRGPPFKRSLKNLMAEHLHKFIQDNVGMCVLFSRAHLSLRKREGSKHKTRS